MKQPIFLIASMLLCLCSLAATKIVQSNTGSGWGNAANWLPHGVPQDGDAVIIPLGLSISVKGSVYSTNPNLTVYIHGNLDFEPSGKLSLGNRSLVQLSSITSTITSNGTSSEQIIIGGGIKYNGSNDGTITGPAFTNNVSPNSTAGTAKTGFTFGVLPVKLTSFTAQGTGNKIHIDWTTVLEEGVKAFELQRSGNGKDWKTIATLQPRNICACATRYTYEDPTAVLGINYYRLRTIEWEGRSHLSFIILAISDAQQSGDFIGMLKGNGSSLQVWVNQERIQLPVQMQILSTNGQVLFKKRLAARTSSFDIQTLPQGIAILVLEDNNGKKAVIKMVK